LQNDDILLAVEGTKIANDGTIRFRKRERIFFDYLFISKFVGDKLKMDVLRNGQKHKLEVELSVFKPLVPVHAFDKLPTYYIYAGLVFCPLVQPYLHEWGDDWWNLAPRKLLVKAMYDIKHMEDEEIVILSNVLIDDINYGYSHMCNLKVLSVNGTKVRSLKHLKQMVEENKEPHIRFDLDDNALIVMEASAAKQESPKIIAKHRVLAAFSDDLI